MDVSGHENEGTPSDLQATVDQLFATMFPGLTADEGGEDEDKDPFAL